MTLLECSQIRTRSPDNYDKSLQSESESSPYRKAPMRSVTVTEVPENAQLIDVREVTEFDEVHAATAVNMPMSNFMSFVESIDKDREVYLICKSGGRSAQVGQYLDNAGFDVINVEGGTDAWVAQGLPTA